MTGTDSGSDECDQGRPVDGGGRGFAQGEWLTC